MDRKEVISIQHIYIVLSQTGTVLSQICQKVTGAKYNHSSVALDPSLDTMYSFGRLWASNPILAGYVKEGKRIGTFKRFKDTKCYVMEVEVSDEQYETLYENLEAMWAKRYLYAYNFPGIVAAAFGLQLKIRHCYYCSEFVYRILKDSGIDPGPERKVIKPVDFLELAHRTVYEGLLREYE